MNWAGISKFEPASAWMTASKGGEMSEPGVQQLFKAVEGEHSVLILPHNDPDPDAIASAVALRHLLAEVLSVDGYIAYKGIIGRAENKALERYLDHPMRRLAGADLGPSRPIALVDTQPGAGNNALSPRSSAAIVLDHHPLREATATAEFADVRPDVGSTSTILTEYLQAVHIEPPRPLATALFYGIKTDTLGLVRGTSAADVAAYVYLQPLVDLEALVDIERAQVPIDYFQRLDAVLHSATIYGDVVISFVGPMRRPDLAAEMADLLLRLRGMQWAICIGVYESRLILSIRTRSQRPGAGRLVQAIIGEQGTAGGHGFMAGGHVPLHGADPEEYAFQLGQRALQHLGVSDRTGKPLTE
jgi:nanoRNase/pAp phosphatase (c-di-AMP/oligoRNAs hydrolase)